MMKPDSDYTGNQRSSKWGFRLWISALILTVLIFVVLGTAGAVRHAAFAVENGGTRLMSANQARIVLSAAEFPRLVRKAVSELLGNTESMIDRKTAEKPGWVRRFPAPEDTGYLLFSGLDPQAKHSIVSLIRISDGKEMARWDPDWATIYKHLTEKKWDRNKGGMSVAEAMHPVLLSDGAIVFSTAPDSGMVRMNLCESKPAWVLDELIHHSNEIGIDGSIWTPAVAQDGFPDNAWLGNHLRDDALARVSVDGHLLEKESFVRILRENGLKTMLLGVSGYQLNSDPIHMNQISVAPSDSRYWKRGDLLISTRNLSAVFLYRPSTRRIIWYRQGPWMNQHSARFVDDHRISVFDNNVFVGGGYRFVSAGDTNRIFVYDFDKDQVSQPFEALLAEAKPMTMSQGRARILPDGGLFVEESDLGRHLRYTKDRLLWSRVNDFDDKHIGRVSWSRYLTAEEARIPLRAIEKHPCQNYSMTDR